MRTSTAALLLGLAHALHAAPAEAGNKPYKWQSSQGYTWLLKTWEGRSATKLVQAWGIPDRTFDLADDVTVYVYEKARSTTTPAYAISTYNPYTNMVTTDTYGGDTITWSCTTEFHVQDDTIVFWKWTGNDCRYAAPPYFDAVVVDAPGSGGVRVSEIPAGSTFTALAPGDVIVKLGTIPTPDRASFLAVLDRYSAHVEALVELLRDGKRKRVRLRIEEQPVPAKAG